MEQPQTRMVHLKYIFQITQAINKKYQVLQALQKTQVQQRGKYGLLPIFGEIQQPLRR